MRIKRFKSLTVALVLGLAAAVAFAASAHFIKASAARQGNNLVVSFKLAGLGNNQTITVTASARATAEYQCINKAGTNPSDPKKQQVTADVSVSGNFTSDQNGNVVGSLTITPPPSTLKCPTGQRRVLVSVSYTNVRVSGGGTSKAIAGTF